MNLDQLETLVAIVETGSFRAASERLSRSQPALSMAVKNLEDEFDLQIFDRSEYRPKLTEAGTAFLAVARSTLEAAQYAARVGRELGKNKAETRLHVSVDPLISSEVLELIALECSRPLLPVNLIIDKSILNQSHKALLEGSTDLAIGPRPDSSQEIESIYLEDVVLVCAVSRKLLQEKRKPTKTFLTQQPQVLVYDKNFEDSVGNKLLPKPIFKDSGLKIYAPDHFTKLKLIVDGVGWGRISKSEFEKFEDLVVVDKNICPEIRLELCLLRPRLRSIGPIAQAIWKAFKTRSEK